MGKPAVSSTRVFRSGTEARLLATLRKASSRVRAPKLASAFPSCGAPSDATSWGCALGDTLENFTPRTTCFNHADSSAELRRLKTQLDEQRKQIEQLLATVEA